MGQLEHAGIEGVNDVGCGEDGEHVRRRYAGVEGICGEEDAVAERGVCVDVKPAIVLGV